MNGLTLLLGTLAAASLFYGLRWAVRAVTGLRAFCRTARVDLPRAVQPGERPTVHCTREIDDRAPVAIIDAGMLRAGRKPRAPRHGHGAQLALLLLALLIAACDSDTHTTPPRACQSPAALYADLRDTYGADPVAIASDGYTVFTTWRNADLVWITRHDKMHCGEVVFVGQSLELIPL